MTNDVPIISDSPESALETGAKDDSDAYSDDGSHVSEAQALILSKSETRRITRVKIGVLLFITVAAFLATTGVYFSSKESEEKDFHVRVSTIVHGL
jgi:hypothetical protein